MLCPLFCIDDGYVVRYVLFCVLGVAYFVLGDGYGWYYVCLFDCGVVSFVTSVLLSCIDNDYSLYCVCCFVCSAVCLGGVMTTLYCMSYVLFLVSAFVLGHDYPLLYVLRSVFGVSLYVLGVCRLL